MLTTDPFLLLKNYSELKSLSMEEITKILKNISKSIATITEGQARRTHSNPGFGSIKNEDNKLLTVKVFNYDEGILAEYKTTPEIKLCDDGTVHHVLKALMVYCNVPREIIIKTEEENSGLRSADLRIFGIKKKVWGLKEEIGEIVEAISLVEETKNTIIERLEKEGISCL